MDGIAERLRLPWQRCDTSGSNCNAIGTGGGVQSYVVTSADVGSTLEVIVTATNTTGSTPATSEPTATVQAASTSTTFGKTTVGATPDVAGANRKRVNRYALSGNASVSKLSVYLQPTSAQRDAGLWRA